MGGRTARNTTPAAWNDGMLLIVPVLTVLAVALAEPAHASDFTASIFIIPDPPQITSIVAADPNNSAAGYSNGDTITVRFSEPTNRPGGTGTQTKAQVDGLFSFSSTLGTGYTGRWINPSTFIITVTDTGAGNPVIGVFKITVIGAVKNSAGTSLSSTSESPVLEGSFGTQAGPFITDFVADDPDNSSPQYSAGDTLTIRFSEPTNRPGGTGTQTKAQVDGLFSFSNPIGSDYSGQWSNPRTFKITAIDVTGGSPQIGVTTTEPAGTTQILNSAATSLASIGKSSPLSGSFGTFAITQTVEQGNTLTAPLPSGTTSSITLPSDSSGEVTVQRSSATNNAASGGGSIQFVGEVIDITLGSGVSCASGCGISFTFTSSDLASGTDPISVKVFHDENGDDDFGDAGEQLATTVIEESTGVFVASATITSTSNVGLGTVTPAPAPPTPSTPSSTGGGGGGGGKRAAAAAGASAGAGGSEGGFGGIIKPETQPAPKPIPTWVRSVAGWWSQGMLSENYFIHGIQYLIKQDLIQVKETAEPRPDRMPGWTKAAAGWWSEGKISDAEFYDFVEWLANNNLIPTK